MQVLKSRELSAAECLFAVQGLQYYHSSSSTGRISLNVGSREYASEEDKTGGDADQVVKLNKFDTFCEGKNDGTIAEHVSFHTNNRSRAPDVPVYTHADTRSTWPLTENYCKTQLILHKPNVKQFSDVKGDFQD